MDAYNERAVAARKSTKEKIASDKLKNEAKEQAIRLGKDLEKVRGERNRLKDELRDLVIIKKSLEKKSSI